jgi:tetratricopeptide (TPR) repeat protein
VAYRVVVYFIRASAHKQAGDTEAYRSDLDEGLRLQPTDELSFIARSLARLPADPKGALADLDQALALNPRSALALRNKAHILSEHLGRTEDAVAALDGALAVRSGDLLARAGRAVLLARLGKREAALADARLVETGATESGLIYQIAGVYALTARPGDRATALRLLRKAFQQEGRWVDVAPRDPDLTALHGDPDFQALLRLARRWYGREG